MLLFNHVRSYAPYNMSSMLSDTKNNTVTNFKIHSFKKYIFISELYCSGQNLLEIDFYDIIQIFKFVNLKIFNLIILTFKLVK